MTMTLGFDVFEYFEALVGETGAQAALVAIAKHTPTASIRAARFVDNGYAITAIDETGAQRTPSNVDAIRAAIASVDGFVSWPSEDAPEGLPPVILPGSGWDLPALLAEPAMQALAERERFIAQTCETERACSLVGEAAIELLCVAERHRLIAVFR